MEESTSISEMQKFRFGSKIFFSDGEDGTLTSVGFDARRLTSIGVKPGRIFSKTIYLPYEAVEDAKGESITLNISHDQLSAASTSEPAGALFTAKSVVQKADSSAKGLLHLIAVHPQSGELAYCVVRNLRAGQSNLIEQQYITKLEKDQILVALPDATLQKLPLYRSDAELQQEVENTLFDLTLLHVDFKGMNIRVRDSMLYLDGNISSSLRADVVLDQASGVPGLLQIKNNLIGDDTLAGDLAMALAHDARTRDLPIGVYPRLGDVRLSGAVHTAEQRVAAEEIARPFPGVRSVANDLQVNPKTDILHVMSSSEGGEAEDKVPGKYIRHTK